MSDKVKKEKNYSKVMCSMLIKICKGNDLLVDNIKIMDENRKEMHSVLMTIYEKAIRE